ncbi:unnamed protein product [Dicrocoelium dendriticum]|nr:unnamed protein product [Dicrocoelium dendriticum]
MCIMTIALQLVLSVILSIHACNIVSLAEASRSNIQTPALTYERKLFERFKERYHKRYTGVSEEEFRYEVFKENVRRARMLDRSGRIEAEFGVTKFSDLTVQEFRYHYANALPSWSFEWANGVADVPEGGIHSEEFDWRTHGAVTRVKDQGQCGSCWAFSTVANIESQWFLHKGELLSLSEQQLVDCDRTDSGCNGGWMSSAFRSVMSMGGLESDATYSYHPWRGKCHMDRYQFVAYVNGTINLPRNERKLAAWLEQKGPISVAINADLLQFYTGGILDPLDQNCPSSGINHAVLLVGFGTSILETPFWTVKNSWGKDWGEEGYFRIRRGVGACGINKYAITSIVH